MNCANNPEEFKSIPFGYLEFLVIIGCYTIAKESPRILSNPKEFYQNFKVPSQKKNYRISKEYVTISK